MKFLIRYFFKAVRLILTPFVLLHHWILTPKGIKRDPEAQQQVDAQTRKLVLYHFNTCPFCLKVRREVHRLSLDIELRNAQHQGPHRDELIAGGGQAKVPCLRITHDDGSESWMYESDDINAYLHQQFAPAA